MSVHVCRFVLRAERIRQLETQVKAGVTGNGQPSSLQVAERNTDQLNRCRYWLVGCAGGLAAPD